MKIKRLLALIYTLCLVLILMSATDGMAAESKKPLKIGFMWDLTGGYGPMGQVYQRTASIWAELLNKSGGIKGHPIEYVVADGQSDVNKSILVAKKLIELEKVHVAIGGISGAIALGFAPVFEESKVPFIAVLQRSFLT